MVSKRVLSIALVLCLFCFCPGLKADDAPQEPPAGAQPDPFEQPSVAQPEPQGDAIPPANGTDQTATPDPNQVEQLPLDNTTNPEAAPPADQTPAPVPADSNGKLELLPEKPAKPEELVVPPAQQAGNAYDYYTEPGTVMHEQEKEKSQKRPWFSLLFEDIRRGSQGNTFTNGDNVTTSGDSGLSLGIDGRVWGMENNLLSLHLNGFLSFLDVAFGRLGATVELEPFRRFLLIGGVHSFVMNPPLGIEYSFSKAHNYGIGAQYDFYVSPGASVGVRYYNMIGLSTISIVFSMDPTPRAKSTSTNYRYQQ